MDMYDNGYQMSEVLGAEYTVFGIITLVINFAAWWMLFKKADLPGWYGIVPILNLIYLVKVATGGSGWGAVLFFIPLVNVIYAIYVYWQLGKSFGKSSLFCLGLVLLQNIFILILAFGKSQYIGPKGKPTSYTYNG